MAAIPSNYCSVCQIRLNSQVQLDQHFTGRAHANKLREITLCASANAQGSIADQARAQFVKQFVPEGTVVPSNNSVWCGICQIVFNSKIQADQHYKGLKHINKKETLTSGIEQPSPQGHTDKVSVKDANKRKSCEISCDVCCLSFTSEEQAQQHLSGSKHAKKLKMSRIDCGGYSDNIMCEICQLTFNSKIILQQHLAGRKHAKRKQMESLSSNTALEKKGSTFYCGFCNVHLNSLEQLKQHQEGSQHLAVLERARLDQTKKK